MCSVLYVVYVQHSEDIQVGSLKKRGNETQQRNTAWNLTRITTRLTDNSGHRELEFLLSADEL